MWRIANMGEGRYYIRDQELFEKTTRHTNTLEHWYPPADDGGSVNEGHARLLCDLFNARDYGIVVLEDE